VEGSARKYEDYSTRAWPAVVALGDALDFQAAIGQAEKDRRYAAMWQRVYGQVEGDGRLRWSSPVEEDLRSMIMAVGVRGTPAPDVASALLRDVGADLRAFGAPLDALRVSPNLVTTDDELDRVLGAAAEASA
jgi:selenocysteine lyase/cysteine desulfurase